MSPSPQDLIRLCFEGNLALRGQLTASEHNPGVSQQRQEDGAKEVTETPLP